MLVMKAFHLVAMVCWFAGLFYLPRLFVYHADTKDDIGHMRFKMMEQRLYYGITWPAGVMTTGLGIGLIFSNPTYYWHAGWMHAKLFLVVLLWGYHLACGHFRRQFNQDANGRTARFYRWFNEVPTLLLIGIVCLVIIKP